MNAESKQPLRIATLRLQGYRVFKDLQANLGNLEVIVGANGSGKTALFEFLRFLRDSLDKDIPPYVVGSGQQVFHQGLDPIIGWEISFTNGLNYHAQILGPVGRIQIIDEKLEKDDQIYLRRQDSDWFS